MNKKMLLRHLIRIAVILLVSGGLLYAIREEEKAKSASRTYGEAAIFSTMSTMCTVQLFGQENTDFANPLNAVRDEIRRIEKICNVFDPESELSKLNRTAHVAPFVCSDDLWEILCLARRYYVETDGAFDITIEPLITLWGFSRNNRVLPKQSEIDAAKTHVGLDKVVFNESDKSISFPAPGIRLTLGGIAKGWALDKAAKLLREKYNFRQGFLDLGGNVLTLNEPPAGKTGYFAGVRSPFDRERIVGRTAILNEAISTSGNYERYVVIDGHHYTHIVDPRDGQPVENMLSVSVVAPTGVESDALSTAIFIGGEKLAEKLFRNNPDRKILGFIRNPETGGVTSFSFGTRWDFQIPEPPVAASSVTASAATADSPAAE